jgi:hypothetical protein
MQTKKTVESINEKFDLVFCEFDPRASQDIQLFFSDEYQQLVEEARIELEKLPGKAIRSAEFVGKNPTNNGPMAQARIDGYMCALSELREALKERGLI